jgi:hypothetical protein
MRQGHGETGASPDLWTLQEFDTVRGEAWCALLLQNVAGKIVRGCTGTRSTLKALSRTLRISPRELPRTTREEFFLRMNPAVLRALDEFELLKRHCSGGRDEIRSKR